MMVVPNYFCKVILIFSVWEVGTNDVVTKRKDDVRLGNGARDVCSEFTKQYKQCPLCFHSDIREAFQPSHPTLLPKNDLNEILTELFDRMPPTIIHRHTQIEDSNPSLSQSHPSLLRVYSLPQYTNMNTNQTYLTQINN